MPAKMIFDARDEAPEHLREQLKEEDGKFVLDPKGLLEKNTELLGENKRYKDLAKQLDKYKDIDPVKAKEALEKMQLMEEDAAKKAGEWDRLKITLQEQHKTELKKLEERATSAETKYTNYRIDNALLSEITSAKGEPELLMLPLRRFVKLDEAGEPYVVDPQGNKRIGLDGKGNPMTLKELIGEAKKNEKYSRAFEASSASGGGATNSGQRQNAGGAFTMTREQARDSQAYGRLRAEAAKAGKTVEITD